MLKVIFIESMHGRPLDKMALIECVASFSGQLKMTENGGYIPVYHSLAERFELEDRRFPGSKKLQDFQAESVQRLLNPELPDWPEEMQQSRNTKKVSIEIIHQPLNE